VVIAVCLALTLAEAWGADPALPAAPNTPTATSPEAPSPSANGGGTPQLKREDGNWELNADLDVQLSPTLESALQHGLPLYFTLRFTLTKPRWYWLDAELVDLRRDYRVSYHALTRQYRVSAGALALSYPTLAEAMRAVAGVHGWVVAEGARFKAGERYRVRLELRLDGSRLPKPLQINLLGRGEWSTDAEVDWEFAP
jgi:hypothetical protein